LYLIPIEWIPSLLNGGNAAGVWSWQRMRGSILPLSHTSSWRGA